MFPLVAQWVESRETQKEFCQFHSLSLGTFSYWVKKYREQNSFPEKPGGFVSLSIAGPSRGEIEVVYPNGVKIQTFLEAEAVFIRDLAGQC